MCYVTRIALTVVLLCYFQGFSQDFGGSDGAIRRLCESNCCLDEVCIASMCICVILLKLLSRMFCCVIFKVSARILLVAMQWRQQWRDS